MPASEFRKGDRVLARFGGAGGDWYPGEVATARKDGTYRIQYDDGDVDTRLAPKHIKLQSPPPRPTREGNRTATPKGAPSKVATKRLKSRGAAGRSKRAAPPAAGDGAGGVVSATPATTAAAAATAAGDCGSGSGGGGMSSYELARLHKISKNNAMLRELGLDSTMVCDVISGAGNSGGDTAGGAAAVSRHVKQLGIKRARRERKAREPSRRSLRVQGKGADGVELPPGFKEPSGKGGYGRLYHREEEDELSISGNVEVDEDGQLFLQSLRLRAEQQRKEAAAAAAAKHGKPTKGKGKGKGKGSKGLKQSPGSEGRSGGWGGGAASDADLDVDEEDDAAAAAAAAPVGADLIKYAERLARLRVDEDEGVRRVTPDRIYSMAFSPSCDQLVVAAGDKVGNFGMWACGASFGADGVFSARPHSHTLAGVLFNPVDPAKIFTCAYDGRVLELDTTKTTFSEVHSNGGEASLFDMACDPACAAVYIARGDGGLTRLDRRSPGGAGAGACAGSKGSLGGKGSKTSAGSAGGGRTTWMLHQKKINTVSLQPGHPHNLSTASLDRTVAIWDLRSMGRPVHVLPHGLSVNQSSFSPDGAWLCTVAQDNLLRCYDAAALIAAPQKQKGGALAQPKRSFRHDNRTGRWLTTFKVCWDPKQPNAFIVGSMDQPRCVEVFSAECTRIMRMRTDAVRSVQSLNVFHSSRDAVASCNSSGKVHLWLPP